MKASELIRTKLEQNGGTATVQGYKGNLYKIWLTPDKEAVGCEKIPFDFQLNIFDEIVGYMQSHKGKIKKGQGRNHRFGEPECDENTVVGIIAIHNQHPKIGDSVLDPQFAFSAILAWADIVYNKFGYLELK